MTQSWQSPIGAEPGDPTDPPDPVELDDPTDPGDLADDPDPAEPGEDRTRLYSLIGIAGAFACPIVGILVGLLALTTARKSGQSPALAYVAIVLSLITAITFATLTANGTISLTG